MAAPVQLRITLVDSEPEVWRQLLVPADMDLSTLHATIQQAMGWQQLHDYSFQIGLGAEKSLVEGEKSLFDVFDDAGERPVYYNYDSDNGWRHRLVIEASTAESIDQMPVCIAGAAACPPEGSGGIWGYDRLLVRLEDMDDPDYVDLLDRYGDFDPDAFDLAAANARLSA